VLVLIASIAVVAGCGKSANTTSQAGQQSPNGSSRAGYLQAGPSDAIFVQWTGTGDAITGSFVLSPNGDFPGATYSFTGSVAGDKITIRFGKTIPHTGDDDGDSLGLPPAA